MRLASKSRKLFRDFRLENIKQTEKEKLWTWDERLNAEIGEVESLLNEN